MRYKGFVQKLLAPVYGPLRYSTVRLAQLGEHRSAERKVVDWNPGQTNNQGL